MKDIQEEVRIFFEFLEEEDQRYQEMYLRADEMRRLAAERGDSELVQCLTGSLEQFNQERERCKMISEFVSQLSKASDEATKQNDKDKAKIKQLEDLLQKNT